MARLRVIVIWGALALAILVPFVIATTSPYLAYRQTLYNIAGFAGVLGLGAMLLQPLLAAGYLPGLPARPGRRVHRWVGATLVALVVLHVVGLWITNPADATDALLLRSPTPFSVWGVAAMWAIFAAALMASIRKRWRIRPRVWRMGHTALALVIVTGSILHAMLIEGTMGFASKSALCLLVGLATAKAVIDLRAWAGWRKTRA